MWLSNELFRSVVDSTPLISIDLVVQNSKGECLLGQRLNRPAQDNWFVPVDASSKMKPWMRPLTG